MRKLLHLVDLIPQLPFSFSFHFRFCLAADASAALKKTKRKKLLEMCAGDSSGVTRRLTLERCVHLYSNTYGEGQGEDDVEEEETMEVER